MLAFQYQEWYIRKQNTTGKLKCFILEGGKKEKYYTPTALMATNSVQYVYVLCILLVCYSLTKMQLPQQLPLHFSRWIKRGEGGGQEITKQKGKQQRKEKQKREKKEKKKKRTPNAAGIKTF